MRESKINEKMDPVFFQPEPTTVGFQWIIYNINIAVVSNLVDGADERDNYRTSE